MRYRTVIVSCIMLFITLIVLSFGFGFISLDIPYDFNSHSESKTVNLTVGTQTTTEEKISLGKFPAWTLIEIDYSASDEVGVKIASTKFGNYQHRGDWSSQGSDRYLLTASKSVSVYFSAIDVTEYDNSNLGGFYPSYQSKSIAISISIKITESKTIPSTIIFFSAFTFLVYTYLSRRYRKDWDSEYQLTTKDVARLKFAYRNNNQRCNICGKFKINRIKILGRYCSYTCDLIFNSYILYLLLAVSGISSLFIPWFIFPTLLLYGVSVYFLEIDTHQYRYASNEMELTDTYVKPQNTIKSEIVNPNKMQEIGKTKYIADLNKSFLNCCYQTARLQEKYCVCGRLVPEELIQYLYP